MDKVNIEQIISSAKEKANMSLMTSDNPLFTYSIEKIGKSILRTFNDGSLLTDSFYSEIHKLRENKEGENATSKNSFYSRLLLLEQSLKDVILFSQDSQYDDFLMTEYKNTLNRIENICSVTGINFNCFIGGIYMHSLKSNAGRYFTDHLLQNYINPNSFLSSGMVVDIADENLPLTSPVHLATLYNDVESIKNLLPNTVFSQIELISHNNVQKDENNNIFIMPSTKLKEINIDKNKLSEAYEQIESHVFESPIAKKHSLFRKGRLIFQQECILPIKDLCMLLSFDFRFKKEKKVSNLLSYDTVNQLRDIYKSAGFLTEEKEAIILSSSLINKPSEYVLFKDWNWSVDNYFAISVMLKKKDLNICDSSTFELMNRINTDISDYLKKEYNTNSDSYNTYIKNITNGYHEFIKIITIASCIANIDDRKESLLKTINNDIENFFTVLNNIRKQSSDIWEKEDTNNIIRNMIKEVSTSIEKTLSSVSKCDKDIVMYINTTFEKNWLAFSFSNEKETKPEVKKRI